MDSSLPKHLSKAHANFFANIHGLYAVVKATDEQTKGFPKQEQTIERALRPPARKQNQPFKPPVQRDLTSFADSMTLPSTQVRSLVLGVPLKAPEQKRQLPKPREPKQELRPKDTRLTCMSSPPAVTIMPSPAIASVVTSQSFRLEFKY